jgi:hypothetical protein
LENYESDSSVETDDDTDPEVGGDAGTGPEASSIVKPRRKTRAAAAAKQSASTAAAKVAAVKTAEKKKRKTSPLPVVRTLVILTPLTKEVTSNDEEDEVTEEPLVVEERSVRRLLSPAAKRQWELAQKTTEDALRQGLEMQRAAAAMQVKMPVLIRLQPFRLKPRVPTMTR